MSTAQIYQQSQVFRKKFNKWIDQPWNVASDLIGKGEVTKIGERDFEIPAKLTNGGRPGTFNMQGGDMGRGSGPSGLKMVSAAFPFRLNFEIDHLSIQAAENTGIENPFKAMIKDAIPEYMIYRNKMMHCDGTAVLGTATATATVSSKTQYTCNVATGVMLMRRGQYLTVYNNALTSVLSANTLYIQQWDPVARTILMSGLVPSAGNTDKMCFEGVTGSSPAGINGIPYFNSSATSGTTLGINRANENQIISTSVSGSGGLTHEHGLAIYHRNLKRWGSAANSLTGLCPVSQQAAIWTNVMSLQVIDIGSTSAQAVDRLPKLKGKQAFMWCNMPHMVDPEQDETRIDYLIPEMFGWARIKELDFYEVPGVTGPAARFFPLTGGSGAPAAAVWFGLTANENLYSINPGAGSFISSLPQSTLYQ